MKVKNSFLYAFISSRSEYYPSKNLFLKLNKNKKFDFKLILGGSLLSKKFGKIQNEIKKDGFKFDKISFQLPGKDIQSFHNSIIDIIKKNSLFLKNKKIDALIIIGDRYESFLVSLIAYTYQIKIIHISGGEITKGSMDNIFRAGISNMSEIHFTNGIYQW